MLKNIKSILKNKKIGLITLTLILCISLGILVIQKSYSLETGSNELASARGEVSLHYQYYHSDRFSDDENQAIVTADDASYNGWIIKKSNTTVCTFSGDTCSFSDHTTDPDGLTIYNPTTLKSYSLTYEQISYSVSPTEIELEEGTLTFYRITTNLLYDVVENDINEFGGRRNKAWSDSTDEDGRILVAGRNRVYYYNVAGHNNVRFGGFCWQIIRTTTRGGVKLIYNGVYDETNKCNNTGEAQQIGTSKFNNGYDDAKYVGLKYQTTSDNDTNSTILDYLYDWYENNLEYYYSKYLEDTIFCNDRTGDTDYMKAATGTTWHGIGTGKFYYHNYDDEDFNSLSCDNKKDMFSTVNNYAKLDYPIGLMTKQEYLLGFKGNGTGNVFQTGNEYWLLSPVSVADAGDEVTPTGVSYVHSDGAFSWGKHPDTALGVRPVISLAPKTEYAGGVGSTTDPYVVPTITQVSISGGKEKVYGSDDTILTCNANVSYPDTFKKYYSFGYSNTATGTIDSWTDVSESNKLTISKDDADNYFVGKRYYKCRVYVTDGTTKSDVVESSNNTEMMVRNAKITFDAGTNGGTLDGTSPLYTRAGQIIMYKTATGTIDSAIVPTAKSSGNLGFMGWYTTPEDTGTTRGAKVLNSNGSFTGAKVSIKDSENNTIPVTTANSWALTSDITLYARFDTVVYWDVTYAVDDGYLDGTPSEEVPTGGSPSGRRTIPRAGYELKGWTCTQTVNLIDGKQITAGNLITPEQLKLVEVTKNLDFVAVHEKIKITVTYRSTNGIINGEKTEIKNYEEKPSGRRYQKEGGQIHEGIDIRSVSDEDYKLRDKPWYANRDVVVQTGDGPEETIPERTYMDDTQVENIKLKSNVTLTLEYKLVDSAIGGDFGTCKWGITQSGEMTIYAENGSLGCELGEIESATQTPWYNYRNMIKSVEVGENVRANENSSYLFANLPEVTKIDLSNLDTTGVKNMSHMFDGDTNLVKITFGDNFNTNDVENMEAMFKDCKSLTNVDLSKFNTENVTTMKDMFSGCSGLVRLDVTGFDTQNVEDMSGMFAHCSNLKELDLTSFDTSNVKDMSNMFDGCTKLSEIDITKTLFDTSNVEDMSNMFNDCPNFGPEKIEELGLDISTASDSAAELVFENKTITVGYSESSNEINIKQENPNNPSGGSGMYKFEKIATGSEANISINDNKIVIPAGKSVGTYKIKIKATDILFNESGTDEKYTKEAEYKIVISTESILDPGTPEMSSGTTIIYGEKDVTLKCTENTTYENQTDVTKYYLFGYSTDENATIDNITWLDAQESDKDADGRSIITQATLKINKNEYIGTRYYRCGVFGRKKVDEDTNIDSNRVFSEGTAAVSINNAAITFNIAKEGGTLTGNSILYTRYGQSDLYTSITGTEESDKGNYPTAKKAGYSFEGWYSGSEGGTKIVNSNGSFANTNIAGYVENGKWIITKNITLYGHYTKNGSESDELGYYGVLTSLRAYLKTYKDVTLVFPKVEDATGYRICYKVSTSKNYNCNDRSSIGGIKLAAGKKYNFKVSPYKIINNKKFVSPNGKETSIYTLKKMSKPKVKKASSKKVKVTIKKVSGATGYQISTSTKKKKGYKVVKTVGVKTTKVKIKAKKGKKVYYKVRAYKSENGKKIYAPYSKVKKYTLR